MFAWIEKLFIKNTAQIQHESLQRFMKRLGYDGFTEGRFHKVDRSVESYSIPGCELISHRTAVRLHNEDVWVGNGNWTVSPQFNLAICINVELVQYAQSRRLVKRCKQQMVEKQGEFTIITQSHVVEFVGRGLARATGLI